MYIKAFIKTSSGGTVFYKDGYTDLRGRFDYASCNSASELKAIKRFSIFIMSDELGSMIREAAPPQTTGTHGIID